MPAHEFIVITYAVPGEEAEFGRWYKEQHIPDLLAVPGITAATPYAVESVKLPSDVGTPDAVVIYTIEADDPMTVIEDVGGRMGTPAMPSTPALDSSRTIALLATPAHETPAR